MKSGYAEHTVTTRSGRTVRQMIPLAIADRSKTSSCGTTIPKSKNDSFGQAKSQDHDALNARIYCGFCPKSYWSVSRLKLHLETDHSMTANNTKQEELT